MSLSGKDIQKVICIRETQKRNLCCENVKYLFSDWENDVLSLNANGYLVEYEVKISRSDFLADRKKARFFHYDTLCSIAYTPNRFYYATPPGLIHKSELPWFAGLMYVGDTAEVIQKAPLMHRTCHDRTRVLAKFCRVLQERTYLGGCALTVRNKELDARRMEKR